MDNSGEFFHRFPVQQEIHLDQISRFVAGVLIVKTTEDTIMKNVRLLSKELFGTKLKKSVVVSYWLPFLTLHSQTTSI